MNAPAVATASASLASTVAAAAGAVVIVTLKQGPVGVILMQPGANCSQMVRSNTYGAIASVASSVGPGVTARRSTCPSRSRGTSLGSAPTAALYSRYSASGRVRAAAALT